MKRLASIAVGAVLGWAAAAAIAQNLAIFPGVLPDDLTSPVPPPPPQGLSSPWLQVDIGSPSVAGDAYDAANVLTIIGQGDINNFNDTGHLVYQEISGDRYVSELIASLTGDSIYRRAGPTARDDDTETQTRYCWTTIDGLDQGVRFQYKLVPDEFDYFSTSSTPVVLPIRLKTEVNAGVCTGYRDDNDDGTWDVVGSTAITFSGSIFYGKAISSGAEPTVATSTGQMPVIGTVGGSAGTVQFTTSSQSQGENVTPLVLSVSRASGTSGAASVQINDTGGTAVAGTDYTDPPFPVTLNWSAADGATKTQNVTLIDRSGIQASRDLDLTLQNVTGASLGAQTTHEATITDDDNTASNIMWQPGVYAMHNKSVIKGWPYSNIAADITNEICPNSYVQGLILHGNPGWFVNGPSAGSPQYGGTDAGGWGFNAVDAALAALAACGSGRKYLVLSMQECNYGGLPPQDASEMFPEFVLPLDGQGGVGTDTGNVYPVIITTQYEIGINGYCLELADPDIVDLIMDTMIAYCNRYKDDDSFYGLSFTYTPSFPFAPGDIDYGAWNTAWETILAATRTYCPTQMIRQINDWMTPFPSQGIEYEELVDSIDGTIMMNDTNLTEESYGDQIHLGVVGGVDYRGNAEPFTNYWSEIESPDMCGRIGWRTPSELWNHIKDGTDGTVPLRSTHIGITMAAQCDDETGTTDVYDWDAWKIFLSGLAGGATVFDGGATNTPRTPAYVKANICPFSRGCE